MTTTPGKPRESVEEYTENSPDAIPSGTIYSMWTTVKPPAGSKSGSKCGSSPARRPPATTPARPKRSGRP